MMEDSKKFADAILNRRKQLGITQEELANRVGTSKQMVSKYENNQRSPKIFMADAIAAALGTTIDELLEVDSKIIANQEPPDYDGIMSGRPKTEEARILAVGIDKLPKEQRERAVAMFKVMFEPQYADLFTKGADK